MPAPRALPLRGGLTDWTMAINLLALKTWAKAIKRDVVALYFAARDPRVPSYAKLLAGLIAAYALSPIDLIPDFIPVLGYLDDLIIVPLGIMLAVRLIPAPLMAEHRQAALEAERKPRSYAAAAMIALIWLASAGALLWFFGAGRWIEGR